MSKDVYEAVNNIKKLVGYVQRDTNPNLRYSYLSESGVISALRNAMIDEGVICFISGINDIKEERYPNKETTMKNVSLTATVTFFHIQSATSFVVSARGEGFDSGDKSTGKAISIAYKYALSKTFMLESGDDEMKDTLSETKESEKVENILEQVTTIWGELKANKDAAEFGKSSLKKYASDGNLKRLSPEELKSFYAELQSIKQQYLN